MSPRRLLAFMCPLLVAAAACSTDQSSAPDAPPEPRAITVDTDAGAVRGFEDDGVFSYRGIPYAAPPVGERRWRPPEPVEPWTEPLEATEAPPVCPQTAFAGLPVPGFNPSEDCLYLNVDAPAEGTALPVMVWLHGGAFTLGEGLQADGGTAGDRIARQAGVIVVSMNYRLGQIGFLAHSALTAESDAGASGNYGLMDQRAALEWVQRNIEAFGGDPDNVTIFGESAGAFSVCSQMASPGSGGLFHKAILMSGSCERPWSSLEMAESQGDAFAEVLGCSDSSDVLSCMREKPFEELLAALPAGENFGFNPSEEAQGSWYPTLDGLFFEEQPFESFASGRFNQVPTIVGFTREEARLFTWLAEISTPPLVVTEANYEELLTYYLGGDSELASRAAAEYPPGPGSEAILALASVTTDAVFRCPGRTAAAKLSAHVPTYLYQFEYGGGRSQLEVALPLLNIAPPAYDLGAFHSADIAYVFGYDPLLELDLESFSANLLEWQPGTPDESVWLEMLGYFARFAATGDPNESGAPQWPLYAPETDRYLAIDTAARSAENPAAGCAFWDGEDYLASPLFAQ